MHAQPGETAGPSRCPTCKPAEPCQACSRPCCTMMLSHANAMRKCSARSRQRDVGCRRTAIGAVDAAAPPSCARLQQENEGLRHQLTDALQACGATAHIAMADGMQTHVGRCWSHGPGDAFVLGPFRPLRTLTLVVHWPGERNAREIASLRQALSRAQAEKTVLNAEADRLGHQVLGLQQDLTAARSLGRGERARAAGAASPQRVQELEAALLAAAERETALRLVRMLGWICV